MRELPEARASQNSDPGDVACEEGTDALALPWIHGSKDKLGALYVTRIAD